MGSGCPLFLSVWFEKMSYSPAGYPQPCYPQPYHNIFTRASTKGWPSRCTCGLSSSPLPAIRNRTTPQAFHLDQICHRYHFGWLCYNMLVVRILADKMQPIVTEIGAARFLYCLIFLCSLLLSLPGSTWEWVLVSATASWVRTQLVF